MCGIFGYIGEEENAADHCIKGLRGLEYRGYDSAGIAGIKKGEIQCVKAVGKLGNLEEKIRSYSIDFPLAIAHTRWATHGEVTEHNAHPHLDEKSRVAVVHNGIIENYAALRHEMVEEGVIFSSKTDTEVIVQYLARHEGELLQGIIDLQNKMQGSWAVAMVHKNHPGKIIAFARECPLIIAFDPKTGRSMVTSDRNALSIDGIEMAYLAEDEIAFLEKGGIQVFDKNGKAVSKKMEKLGQDAQIASKEGFDHFMLKEIFEQPETVRSALFNRLDNEQATALFETLKPIELQGVKRIVIVACGTSYHAGCIASRLFEEYARIPAQAAIASEFRYQNPIISRDTLVVAISQSGETADTVAAVREAKTKGAKVIAVCNVRGSLLTRESDHTLYLRAGPEISVCSTKAFTSQLTVLLLFTLFLARTTSMDQETGRKFISSLYLLPDQVGKVLSTISAIKQVADKYASYNHFFYLGRQTMYYAALEGALKLKEIAYVEASGYPAGELKHGPIALLDKDLPVVAFTCHRQTQDKMMSSLEQCKARGAPLIVFAFEGDTEAQKIADDCLFIPAVSDALAAILVSIAAQLFAYFIAVKRGTDIDQPRNLAKSVTVE